MVELLVVIGIIAVLISILLPTMNRARAAAAQTVCLSNLRQLAMATYNYAADNRGLNVPTANVGYSTLETIDGVTGNFQQSWNYGQVGFNYSFKKGFLGRYLPSAAIFDCPTMKAVDLPPPDGNMPRTTYGIALSGVKKFSRVQRASETALFGDAIELDSSNGMIVPKSGQLLPPGLSTTDNFHCRHVNNTGDVAFYDGHAEAIPFRRRPSKSHDDDDRYNAMIRNHIGPATPTLIDESMFSNAVSYRAYASQNLAYYFWANKYTKSSS